MPERAELEEIAAALECELTERVRRYPGNKESFAAQLLLSVKDECGALSIGAVTERKKGIEIIYLDLGDNRETIVYDVAADMFLVTAWRDLVEVYNLVN
jgi:hypothetical protein